MASALKSLSLSFAVLLCLLLLLQVYDGLNGAEKTLSSVGTLKEISNRKLLAANDLQAAEVGLKIQSKKGREDERWELRAAPLGPDPLHHHADPKKPRTP